MGKGTKEVSDEKQGVALTRLMNRLIKNIAAHLQKNMDTVDHALEKLDRVMEKADEHGIGVVLRIGYTWDYYRNRGNDEIMERYEKIVYDEQTSDLKSHHKNYKTL